MAGAPVDDKVVAMSFESSKFEEGVNKTITALDKLKAKLQFPNAGKGLEDVGKAAKGVDLSHIGTAVDGVKNRLGALRLVGIGVMANLATSAVSAGSRVLKAFTLDPIKAGFENYETQINAVQTILANTGLKGKAGIGQVNASLKELNDYANKTVYNFSEMARNIGTFTAAGVDLKTATASIKGIANLAALSGSNSQQASTAMYQLSQAIAAGQVHLQDWNSVVNAGMGGKVFQKALANTAQAMGVLKDGSVKLVGPMKQLQINGESFRQALQTKPGQKSWLTSEVLTNTLKQFTGDMSKAQLKAQGFNDAQIKAIQSQGSMAVHAATNIKTFTQLTQALKEEVASAWGAVFKTIFGDLGHATNLFTAVHNVAQNALTNPIYALNKLLEGWAKLGGRTALINGLRNAFHALGAVLAPIKEAFRDIFPATTAQHLVDATKAFERFTKGLIPSHDTVENLRRTFRGLFAVLDIGKQIISGIFHVFGTLLGVIGHGSGGFLSFTARVGDFLVKIDQMLKRGDSINNFFNVIAQAILVPIHAIEHFAHAISNSTQNLHPFQHILDGLSTAFSKLTGQSQKAGSIITPITQGIGQAIGGLGQTITNSLTSVNFNDAATAIAVGFIGALTLTFKKFAQGGFDNAIFSGLFKNISGSFGGLATALKGLGGVFGGVTGVLKGVTGNLEAMQQKLKAEALKEIAIAIALIAASAVALSLVDQTKLNSALGSLTIMFGQLLGSMAILDKIGKSGGFLKMPIIAGSMILLAGAIDLLTLAVLGLSRLNWEQLAKGLGGVGVLLASISVTAKPLGANSAGLIRAGAGIAAIGVALNILALAVRQFGSMDIATLGKGLGAVAVALASIGAASRLFPSGMIAMGAGLVLIAGAMLLLEKSVAAFGALKMDTIGKGLLGLAGALLAIAVAMRVMPKGMIAQAVALGVVSIAIQGIAKAVASFGGMSLEQIAKGLGTLAASLLILGIAMAAMTEVGAGAAALIIAAGAIAILAPALKSLGEMSWVGIIKSMVALAAAFVILGLAGAALTPVVPSLLGLGAALLLIGGGLALAGAGVALVGVGLSAIAVAGPVAIGILIKALESFGKAIPEVAKSFVNGLLSIVQQVAATAPKFVEAIVKIIMALVSAIPPLAPKLGEAILSILNVALKVLGKAFPKVVEAGFQMLMALLKGISSHISEVVTQVADIVAKFLNSIAHNLAKIVLAGANIVASLLKGIARGAGKIASAAIDIVVSLVEGIGRGAGRLVTAAANAMSRFINAIGNAGAKLISAGTNVIVKIVSGIGNAAGRLVTAAASAASKFVTAWGQGAAKIVNSAGKAILNFVNAVDAAVKQYSPQITSSMISVGEDLVAGFVKGIENKLPSVSGIAKTLAHAVPGPVRHLLGSLSPSKVMMEIGHDIVAGLAIGISHHAPVIEASVAMATAAINAVDATAKKHRSSVDSEIKKIISDINSNFAAGLNKDTPDAIKGAFNKLSDQINQEIASLHSKITSEQKRLDQLNKAKKKDHEAINQLTNDIKQQQADIHILNGAHIELSKSMDHEKNQLVALSNEYAKMQQRVDDAKTSLENAKKARDDFAASTTESATVTPDFVTTDKNGNDLPLEDVIHNYIDGVNASGASVSAFADHLAQLKLMGIDNQTYKKLLDIGPAADGFVNEIIGLGPDAVAGINSADAKLQAAAKVLGDNASVVLYQSGVDNAQAMLNGLTDGIDGKTPDGKTPLNTLKQSIDGLIETIVHQVKHKLGIKSPSTIFAEIGSWSVQGMAEGFTNSTKVVTDAVDGVSNDAIEAMKRGMSGVSEVIASHIDPNPTITPVLDLSQVQAAAKDLPGILHPAVSANAAMSIAASKFGSAGQATAEGDAIIKFEQNNYSPESLSAIEIYRQTKNQISQVKNVLAPVR